MNAYYGHDAIDYLTSKIKQVDPKSSSNWNHFHAKFDYPDGKFSGVEGFGSNRQAYSRLRGLGHYILQIPFRAVGKKFSYFEKIDRVVRTFIILESCTLSFETVINISNLRIICIKN